MIIKSSSFLYLFDFDGTLAGDSQWRSIAYNNIACLRTGVHINPADFDIRWCILTGRPKIDKPFIKTFCMLKGLKPEKIFTTPTLFYNFKKTEEAYKFKADFIKSILDEKIKLSFTLFKIERILYVDNDTECIRYLNSVKESYRYMAINVPLLLSDKISMVAI